MFVFLIFATSVTCFVYLNCVLNITNMCIHCQVGELIGGSQREERFEYLENRLDDLKLNKDSFWWYLDLRRYGSGEESIY